MRIAYRIKLRRMQVKTGKKSKEKASTTNNLKVDFASTGFFILYIHLNITLLWNSYLLTQKSLRFHAHTQYFAISHFSLSFFFSIRCSFLIRKLAQHVFHRHHNQLLAKVGFFDVHKCFGGSPFITGHHKKRCFLKMEWLCQCAWVSVILYTVCIKLSGYLSGLACIKMYIVCLHTFAVCKAIRQQPYSFTLTNWCCVCVPMVCAVWTLKTAIATTRSTFQTYSLQDHCRQKHNSKMRVIQWFVERTTHFNSFLFHHFFLILFFLLF